MGIICLEKTIGPKRADVIWKPGLQYLYHSTAAWAVLVVSWSSLLGLHHRDSCAQEWRGTLQGRRGHEVSALQSLAQVVFDDACAHHNVAQAKVGGLTRRSAGDSDHQRRFDAAECGLEVCRDLCRVDLSVLPRQTCHDDVVQSNSADDVFILITGAAPLSMMFGVEHGPSGPQLGGECTYPCDRVVFVWEIEALRRMFTTVVERPGSLLWSRAWFCFIMLKRSLRCHRGHMFSERST